MEKPKRRPVGLTALFWRYLLTAAGSAGAAALIWWAVLGLLFRTEFVMPAAYAANHIPETVEVLTEEFSPENIPHYYRWAVFDSGGGTLDSGSMDRRHLEYARQSLLQGGTSARNFPYTQYHRIFPLAEGRICVLQYDYSVPYADPVWQRVLPDFQLSYAAVLAALWGLLGVLCTRHCTHILQQDVRTITAATRAISDQRLDKPFTGTASVRELGEALEAMDILRQNLAEALACQWAMEQQRQRELSALTHDLKTPLTIISGNGELLLEEPLSDSQRSCADAILRGAERLEQYVGQLRAFSAGDGREDAAVWIALSELFRTWQTAGEDLCGPKGVRFLAQTPPELTLYVQRETMSRAVLNLLDNAARYAGTGGKVVLSARTEGEILAVTVSDTGPGFSAEALARAGQERYTSAASRPQDGHTGWGLYYARHVVRSHRGELVLANTAQGAAAELRWKYWI